MFATVLHLLSCRNKCFHRGPNKR